MYDPGNLLCRKRHLLSSYIFLNISKSVSFVLGDKNNYFHHLIKYLVILPVFAFQNRMTHTPDTLLKTFYFWRYDDFTLYLSVHFIRVGAKEVTEIILTSFKWIPRGFDIV